MAAKRGGQERSVRPSTAAPMLMSRSTQSDRPLAAAYVEIRLFVICRFKSWQLKRINSAKKGHLMKGGPASGVGLVDVGTALDEHLHRRELAVGCRHVQRTVARRFRAYIHIFQPHVLNQNSGQPSPVVRSAKRPKQGMWSGMYRPRALRAP